MTDLWIVNASPIITLAKAGHLRLLLAQAPELWIPEPVALELLAGDPEDPARKQIESGWGKRVPLDRIASEVLEWGLGPGESSVLTLAAQAPSSLAVLDDASARSCARALGIPVTGTLGVILRAKLQGMIPSAAEVVQSLRSANLYLDSKTIQRALAGVGEEWNPYWS